MEAIREPETVVSVRLSLSRYVAVAEQAQRWGFVVKTTGRPNLSATIRRLVGAGLVAEQEQHGKGVNDGQETPSRTL